MKNRFISILIVALVFTGFAGPISAATGEPLIFQMADGQFYHPATGMLSDNKRSIWTAIGWVPSLVEQAPANSVISDPAAPATLKDAIIVARTALGERVAAKQASQALRQVSSYDTFVDVTLAIWNRDTRTIQYVDIKKNGTRMSVETPGVGLDIYVRRTNGVNSEFAIKNDNGEHYVVAVQYPIFKEKWISQYNRVFELEDIVYTPWSKQIHQPEIVEWGKEYLDRTTNSIYEELRQKGIRSRAFSDRLLADVIDPKLTESIAIIEHLGLSSLTGDNAAFIMDSVYIILAANQDKSYAYSRSSANAKGIAQFIPATYKIMTNWEELGLDPSFEEGMADVRNSLKAMVGYLDSELSWMPLAVKDLYYVDPPRVNEYLAAAYNAGGTRVRRAIAMWGDAWSEHHYAPDYYTSRATLRTETIKYVQKLRSVWSMLNPLFGTVLTSAEPSLPARLTEICFSDSCHYVSLDPTTPS